MSGLRLVASAEANDLPAELRKMADEIEAGEFGDARSALVLIDTPEHLFMEARGKARSRYETAGMLCLAQQTVFEDE